MSAQERYLTLKQAAARLQMNSEVFRRACKAGHIPGATKIGGLWRIRASDIDRLFAERDAAGKVIL